MEKFVIGRYYFNSLFKDQADKSFIEDLTRRPFIEEKKFEYALGNFNFEKCENINLFRGTFGRLRKGDFANVYDKKKKEFKKEQMSETADVILEFIINHENHLIFVEYNFLIKPMYFADKFKKIYSSTSSLAELEMDFIFVERDVYETIKEWQRVDHVVFKKLRPSNPSSMDNFKEIEDLLKETKSEKTNIELRAASTKGAKKQQPGLNHESKLIKQSIALSARGYGDARLEGVKNGRRVEVESKRFLKKVEVNFDEDGALKKIVQTIEEIKQKESDE